MCVWAYREELLFLSFALDLVRLASIQCVYFLPFLIIKKQHLPLLLLCCCFAAADFTAAAAADVAAAAIITIIGSQL